MKKRIRKPYTSSLSRRKGHEPGVFHGRQTNRTIVPRGGKTLYSRNLVVRKDELENTHIANNGNIPPRQENATSTVLIPVTPSKILTFSKITFPNDREGEDTWWRYQWLDSEQEWIGRTSNNNDVFQWTIPANAYYLQVSYHVGMQPKVERGTIATDWSPAPEDIIGG